MRQPPTVVHPSARVAGVKGFHRRPSCGAERCRAGRLVGVSLPAVSDAAMPAAVIHLEQVVSLIGRFPALAGVDLTVQSGEVVLLQGANGAGKSTLLRLCSGLASLHDGRATVLGTDLSTSAGRRSVRRRVGLLGHGTALYDDLTVEQNVRFWAAANGSTGDAVDAAMDRLGVGGRLRSVPVSALSAGQRRRTSMAVLVCRRPLLWLLDEPHAGLDREGRDLVDGLVKQAVASGATALVASHELDRVAGLATRVVEVVGGHVRDSGTSTERET